MRPSEIHLTVDIVVIRPGEPEKRILLIRRRNFPFQHQWALPGGFVDKGENLDDAARRELLEETGITAQHLEQLKAFGQPGRDPRGHMVSVAFLAVLTDDNVMPVAADDALDAKWFPVSDLPSLAFDHEQIIDFALSKMG